MNTYSNISGELKAFFSSHPIFKILLPIDLLLLLAGLGVMILGNVFGVYFGGLISGLAYWVFILGLLLVYANMKDTFLYIALLAYGASNILEFLLDLIGMGYFSWGALFNVVIFGGLGFLVFRRSVSAQTRSNIES